MANGGCVRVMRRDARHERGVPSVLKLMGQSLSVHEAANRDPGNLMAGVGGRVRSGSGRDECDQRRSCEGLEPVARRIWLAKRLGL